MNKRQITVFMVLILITIVLVSCGNNSDSSTGANSQPTEQLLVSESADKQPKKEVENAAYSSGVVENILGGFSAKAFQDGDIADEDIQTILQCGQKAPSARNLQPWHFTVIRDSEIAGSLVRDYPQGGVVIVVSGTTEKMEGVDVSFDCALATQNMYIAAQSLGLGAHIYLGGVQSINESMRDTLGIPDGYEAKIFMLIGQIDKSADAISSASQRNPLSEIVNYVG